MPGRFPLTPVALTDDPFCEDGYCGDPAFTPNRYSHARWVGTINYATFDGNVSTPYFIETPLFTSEWVALGTVGGVRDVLALSNSEPTQILPTGILSWRASQVFNFNPASYPTNRKTTPFTLIKYNPNVGSTNIGNPPDVAPGGIGTGAFWGFSPPITSPPALTSFGGSFYSVVEVNERLATYSGVFQFSNDASTVLATWEGL
jgi:hypothetical protein